jgi:outer membrane protein OmpA-like peptidoglycan-associated protein
VKATRRAPCEAWFVPSVQAGLASFAILHAGTVFLLTCAAASTTASEGRLNRYPLRVHALPALGATLLLGCAGGAAQRSSVPAAAPVSVPAPDQHARAPVLARLDAGVAAALPGVPLEVRAGVVQARVPASRVFVPDSTALRAADGLDLAPLARLLRGCQGCAARIVVHTDAIGPAEDNRQFATARAAALVAWLQAAGVPAARLSAHGAGEDEPVASPDTPAGRRANRRVEIIIRP